MAYRDDLEAAVARADALEEELNRLRGGHADKEFVEVERVAEVAKAASDSDPVLPFYPAPRPAPRLAVVCPPPEPTVADFVYSVEVVEQGVRPILLVRVRSVKHLSETFVLGWLRRQYDGETFSGSDGWVATRYGHELNPFDSVAGALGHIVRYEPVGAAEVVEKVFDTVRKTEGL